MTIGGLSPKFAAISGAGGMLNPLTEWLGIPASQQPVDYYGLLGLKRLEESGEAISHGFANRSKQLAPHLNGKSREVAERVLARLMEARACLLNPARKSEYDRRLRGIQDETVDDLPELASDEQLNLALAKPAAGLQYHALAAPVAALPARQAPAPAKPSMAFRV